MEQWKKLGTFIGSHMMIIAPLCVVFGVLFPDIFGQIRPYSTPMFAVMTFQGSLNNTFESVAQAFKRPLNLIVILFCSAVVMPVAAHTISALLFSSNMALVTGATIEYTVPVAVVSFMWSGMYGGDLALALATILVSSLAAPFTIPFTLELLLGATVEVDVVGMMTSMILMIALPALAGMLVNEFTHGWGHEKLSPVLAPAAKIILVLICVGNASTMADDVRHMTLAHVGMAFFIMCFAISGFLLGFGLARVRRLDLPQTVTSCFCTGLRNINAGCVIAAEFFGGSTVFPVMMGTLFQSILASSFGSFMQKHLSHSEPAQ